MTSSVSQIQQVINEYQAYKNSLTTGQNALNNVIAQGTLLYNDATFATLFPASVAAYKTYLQNVQTAINTFVANFPSEPSLNG